MTNYACYVYNTVDGEQHIAFVRAEGEREAMRIVEEQSEEYECSVVAPVPADNEPDWLS